MLFPSLLQRQGWHAARKQEGRSRQDNASPRHSKPRARVVPRLEALEDRTVPSYVFQNLLDDPSAGTAPGQGTQPNAINNSGQIVGFYFDASGVFHSYSQIGNQYTTITPPNESTVRPFSIATGINPQGQIVGAYRGTDGLSHGYLLSGGPYTSLDDPLAVHGTRTFGINAPGQIVGEYLDANFTLRGFLLSGGKYTPIDDPLAGSGAFLGTVPFSINASGRIVGVYIDSAGINHGFLLSGGVYTTMDDPLGVGAQGGTQPSQINDQEQIVGGYFDASGLPHGYIQVGNQYTTVDDPAGNPPGQGSFVNGINDPGQLVGGYYDATGLEHGFLATPVNGNSASARAAPSSTSSGVSESGFGLNLILTTSLIPPTSSGTVSASPDMATCGTLVQPSPSAMHGTAVLAPAQSRAALSSQDVPDSASVVVRPPARDADAWLFAAFGGRDTDGN
jgi:uncharacterized membrane protein